MDQPMGTYLVSALADPDVGTGRFYVLVTLASGEEAPAGTQVMVWVKPQDGHLAEISVRAEREATRYGDRFVAKAPFDSKGAWDVRLMLEGPAGAAQTEFPVNVTPSGLGWLGTVACLIPFAALGALWLRATLRHKEAYEPPVS
jgi:hypothetical protein